MLKKMRVLVALPLLSGAVVVATATGASASPSRGGSGPSSNASCVAKAIDYFDTTPGQVQSHYFLTPLGQYVSWAAKLPNHVCNFND